MKRRRVLSRPCFELREHIVGRLLQQRGCGITKSRDQITRLSRGRFVFVMKTGCFRFRVVLANQVGVSGGEKVGHRRAEDGRHKMGAHEAGRVACHAS